MAPSILAQCNEIAPLLGTFEDGELEPHEMQEVARHLASCEGCEETLAGYSTLGRLLRDATPAPALDGFAMAVQDRIEQLRPPLRIRFGGWLEIQRERFGGAIAIAFAMAAAAILTVVITTPFAHNVVKAGNHPAQVATLDARSLAPDTAVSPGALASAASGEPGTIISKLETSNPDVAVWSEPSQDTTVIWLPDQQP
ncbi:MAG: anti-sigma factor family protein [Candidatus Binataceae bacterium]